jgi:asparagine synthase (glutamine-hydrolysing)
MCGICGIYGSNDINKIERMTAAVSHRGPDSSSVKVVEGKHTLGGARLHITGQSDAPFPYCRDEAGLQVLLNGEIYNYHFLQKKLEDDGHSFFTGTDTEVVWILYHKFGPAFIKHLKGMFAIAILDGDRLILSRDPFGIKPLFYCQNGRQLAFASEIKALLKWIEPQPKLNEAALQDTLTFGYIYSPKETHFNGIQQVGPGEILIFDGENICTERYFTQLGAFSANDTEYDYNHKKMLLSSILPSAMELVGGHSEHEIGVFLSGGVDSSLMAVLCKEAFGKIQTFNIADSPLAPDLPWARRVAKAINSEHHEIFITLQDYIAELPHFVYHYENIIAGGVFDLQGSVAFHLLCKEVSRHVKVALTGEGADELFGGYYWTYTHPLGFADRMRLRLQEATKIVPNDRLTSQVNQLFPLPEDESLYRLNVFDALLKGGLSNYHLWSVDRSSGAFGFEIRPFYLYDDIVKLALDLPVEYKAPKPGVTKLLLKDVAKHYFAPYGLEDICNRKKFGMPAALSQLDIQVRDYINSHVSDAHVQRHPYKRYLTNKTDILMFDLFFYFYFHNSGNFDPAFSLEEALAGGIFENMYS